MRHVAGISSRLTLSVSALLVMSASAFALDNGAARTPPMGWNTFNCWGGAWIADHPVAGKVSTILKATTDTLVANGLRDLGYVYVCADGANGGEAPFWPAKTGFVNWAKPNADYIRSKGMKFGVYTSEFANPLQIASDLAAANVEFIKVDAWTSSDTDPGWQALGNAIGATGKPIVYSTHSSRPGVSHMQRTGGDIDGTWGSMTGNFDANYGALAQQKPGTWADPDMFVIPYLTDVENRAHFSMWCMMSSPLIMGYNFSRLGEVDYQSDIYGLDTKYFPAATQIKVVAIFSNAELIALDQDTIGLSGKRIKGQGALEVWVKTCADGGKAVMFLNRTANSASMNISQAELGLSGIIYVRDLWQHAGAGTFTGSFTKTVASHAAEVYKMDTKPIDPPVKALSRMDRSIAWLKAHGVEVFPQRLVPGILAGNLDKARAFDMRGRSLSLVNQPSVAQGALIVRGSKSQDRVTTEVLWSGVMAIAGQ